MLANRTLYKKHFFAFQATLVVLGSLVCLVWGVSPLAKNTSICGYRTMTSKRQRKTPPEGEIATILLRGAAGVYDTEIQFNGERRVVMLDTGSYLTWFERSFGDDALRKPEYTGPDRKQYHAEIDPILVNWLEDLGKMEVFEGFQKNRMSSGILMTPEDMLESPQLQARNFFQEVEHPSTGPQMYPGPPYQLSDSEWMQTKAPLLGEHNHEVLVGQLGLPEQELTDLSVKGVT